MAEDRGGSAPVHRGPACRDPVQHDLAAHDFVRHDLVRADPAAWAALLAARRDLDGLPHVAGWAEAGRPLIVRRRLPGEGGAHVPLGLPLPPADGKRRIGLALPAAGLTPVPPLPLAAATQHAPALWRPTLHALADLGERHGAPPRPFGSLLWQAVTGLAYLTPASDLDLLWPCTVPVPADLLDGIAALAASAPMRLDGEILLPGGAGIHWSELYAAPEDAAVLVKTGEGVEMRRAGDLRARPRRPGHEIEPRETSTTCPARSSSP